MGSMGMGRVLDFGTPQHTTYPYCGVTGIHRYIANVFILFIYIIITSYCCLIY